MLRLYNTLTRKVDSFHPLTEGKVGLYTCGPTVYNYAHIGNLRTYVFEDILKRVLIFEGYQVRHVMNVTDVGHLTSDADTGEDKIELSARRERKNAKEIADYYFDAFRRDMACLSLLEPDVWCQATEHISEQIALIERLEEKEFTYRLKDGIYFDTSKFPDYRKLARLDVEGLRAGARIELVKGKRNITDFALWKFLPPDKKRLMEWDSPWGVGFPGWHIECSAMALKYLGERLDIHCGGVDHIPVHHTNEIAQSEVAIGHKWVNWWMHGEFLVLPKEKEESATRMAKSGENFITLDEVIKRGFNPLAYRYLCLTAHYRAPLTFTWKTLAAAANGFERLKSHILQLKTKGGSVVAPYLAKFTEAIEDDLNMPRALVVMWEVIKDDHLSGADRYATLLAMDEVLGFRFKEMEQEEILLDEDTKRMISDREKAREQGDFTTADRIRDELLRREIVLEDTPEGTRIRKKAQVRT